ncbi:uncharacterized protein Eint_101140 [Encephalitozoon intestinalis ATCC 50506]|uniref:Exocyst complex component Sec6 n=1 Tax=Encephalitozoon intestinalis (strain ATCC 50506) TaxID=876142 RepID=E0S9Q4_ENCIT|nr:uncharacterized protein Eint_101140 [Encephalitozoon intestinalis ATCC 50506]ADM12439.1 hypothetical protein Eint_101140 [Encephalitozoon intestinalis ATCC 50506]UTX46275.1 hypothetical protein GPK93_10g18750 [Encephalitozoon intestinalis]
MHASELRTLHSSKNYEEIYNIIREEMEKLSLRDKLCTNDLEGLQSSIEEEIRRCVHEQKGIPKPLVNITLLQGESFEARMKSLAISYLGSLCSVSYQEFLNCNFQRLSSLKSCLGWIEESISRVSLKYSHVPDDWSLPREILLKYYVMTKQRVCDYFFYNEVDEEDFIEAFDATIRCEKRLGKLFEKQGCSACVQSTSLEDGACKSKGLSQKETFCPHKTMLSSLFVPNIEIYLERSFKELMESDLNQENVKLCIISGFLDFFRGVEKILKRVEYLNDKSAHRHLVHYFDEYLSLLIKRTRLPGCLNESIIVLNTMLYIRETALDFLDQIIEKSEVEEDIPKIHMQMRKAERLQNTFIDDFLSSYFLGLDFSAPEGLSRKVIQILDKDIMNEEIEGIYEDIRITLVESVVSHVFSGIYSIKVTPRISEALLLETAEIKRYLRTKVSVLPLIDVVEKYLKIFLCPPDNERCFVENFILMSEGIFSFDQIVNNIGSSHGEDRLYLAYKSVVDSFNGVS